MKSWKSNQLNHVTSEETEAQRGAGTHGSFLTSAVLCNCRVCRGLDSHQPCPLTQRSGAAPIHSAQCPRGHAAPTFSAGKGPVLLTPESHVQRGKKTMRPGDID